MKVAGSQFKGHHLGSPHFKTKYIIIRVNNAPQSIPKPPPNMAEKCVLLLLELAPELGHS